MTEQVNPYGSPDFAANEGPAASASSKRFRWRVIPATLLIFFGALFAVMSAFMTAYYLWWLWRNPDASDLGIGPTPVQLVSGVVRFVGGSLFLFAGIQLMRGRRWMALSSFVVAMALLIAAAVLDPSS